MGVEFRQACRGKCRKGTLMIRVRDISMEPFHTLSQLKAKVSKVTGAEITGLEIVRKSVDARKKPNIRFIYTVDISIKGNEQKIVKRCKKASIAPSDEYEPPKAISSDTRPVVVGFGPAGMFASLILAKAGLKPIVIERGEDAETRHKKVQDFFETGKLDTDSNVQFGEGGAGTFSDGKLNTGVNNIRIKWILRQFVKYGAKENILYDAKPHIGTDILLDVVQNIRKEIISLGGEVRFGTKLTGLDIEDSEITGVILNGTERLPCSKVVLAIGHSARDTFRYLKECGAEMEAKPFAMGVRIEHLQKDIDIAQYGDVSQDLPASDYKLAVHLDDRTVYTFCMCPGGYVVAATSEENRVVTNGMSYNARSGENSNSALLVTVNPKDFGSDDALGGMILQEELESKAFRAGGSDYCAPAQKVCDFLQNRESNGKGKVTPTYRPGVKWCDLNNVLPTFISDALKEGLKELDKKLTGFADGDAVLTAIESRSSSPVRIVRNESRQSNITGLYPTGEGAGYAGGIMSAAIDGILTAEAIIDDVRL